jgi:RimJ/RimL family protein N-acetyltransferase
MRADTFRTPDFTLRCPLPGDGAAVFAAVDASRTHLAPWMPWVVDTRTEADSEAWVRGCRGRWLLDKDYAMVIVRDGEVLGGTGLHPRRGPDIAEVGMWIRADRAHQGLGRAVLRALIGWALSDAWRWQRLEWRCDPDNHPSARVAELCGFQLEGTLRRSHVRPDGRLRDTQLWALLRDDPR